MPTGIFEKDVFGQDQTDLPENLVESRSFEWMCRRLLEKEYPPHSHYFWDNEQVAHGDGKSDCPDLAIAIKGTNAFVCVADAKRRKKLAGADVTKIADYRERRNADRAIVLVPKNCNIGPGALKAEQENGVEIWIIEDVQV